MNGDLKSELMQKAFQLGFDYEKTYRGCAQCTIAAIQDTLGFREDNVFKSATGLAAGGGLTGIKTKLKRFLHQFTFEISIHQTPFLIQSFSLVENQV